MRFGKSLAALRRALTLHVRRDTLEHHTLAHHHIHCSTSLHATSEPLTFSAPLASPALHARLLQRTVSSSVRRRCSTDAIDGPADVDDSDRQPTRAVPFAATQAAQVSFLKPFLYNFTIPCIYIVKKYLPGNNERFLFLNTQHHFVYVTSS